MDNEILWANLNYIKSESYSNYYNISNIAISKEILVTKNK